MPGGFARRSSGWISSMRANARIRVSVTVTACALGIVVLPRCPWRRSAELPLADRRRLWQSSRLLRNQGSADAQPRSAGARRRAVFSVLHHGAGLLGQPVGVHDRDVPDHHRRPQPPLAPRRRLPPAAGRTAADGVVSRRWIPDGQRPSPSQGARLSAARPRPIGTSHHRKNRSTRIDGPTSSLISRFSRRSIFRRRTGHSRLRGGPTRRKSKSLPTNPTIPSPEPIAQPILTRLQSSIARSGWSWLSSKPMAWPIRRSWSSSETMARHTCEASSSATKRA